MTNIKSLFENIAKIWLQQLPLFIMLVIYSTAPTFFYEVNHYKTYLLIVLPQTVLPSMLLCILASWRRWSWWMVFVFANLLWLMEMGCLFCQHQRMWSYIGLLIAQSNPKESNEYLSTVYVNMFEALLAVAVSMALFYLLDRYWRVLSGNLINKFLHSATDRIIMRCVGLILVMSVIYSPVSIYAVAIKETNYHKRVSDPRRIYLTASTWTMYAFVLNDIFNNPDFKTLPLLAHTTSSAEVTHDGRRDSLTVVYVIGESFTRNRSSLYGYPYDTNPLMAKELTDSSLIIFDNVISRWHVTYEVYRTMFSTYNIQDDKSFESYPLLPALMKKAGYKVAYLDNQSSIANGIGDLESTYFFKNKEIRECFLDFFNDKTEAFDADFVDKYTSPFMDAGENNLAIYHLMGQHLFYGFRYPESFTHFTKADYANYEGLSEKGAETMAEFDNATLYNDYTLHKIIDKIRDKNAILIYAPDHGEEAYDYREVGNREGNSPITSVRLYYEVPVMIWMSSSFRQKYPDIVSALRSNTHKAIYNSDLPHTILDITGIKTATFNPEVSLIREGKGRTHRHVMKDNIDYDAMHDEIYRQKLRYEK